MNRWLAQLKKNDFTENKYSQNTQNPIKPTFGGFEGSKSEGKEKNKPASNKWLSLLEGGKSPEKEHLAKLIEQPRGAKVWHLTVKAQDGLSTNGMTVIDPARLTDEQFLKVHADKFGADRIVEYS